MEPMSTTGTIATAAKAGALSALIAMVATDKDLMMVFIVGVVGGLAYVGKEFVVEEFKAKPVKTVMNMFASMMMAVALTGFVFYAGKDGFNHHVKDLGGFIWIFLAFMAAMNQKRVSVFLANLAETYLSRKAKGDDS